MADLSAMNFGRPNGLRTTTDKMAAPKKAIAVAFVN
jgi:hypothetical protein